MTTVLLPPDPDTTTASALRWVTRKDFDMARRLLSNLTPAQLAEARMNASRLALLIASMTPEGVAAAALRPDSLAEVTSS